MIRKATFADIDSILDVTKACAKKMVEDGIFQWNENYPSRSAFETDVKSDELFVLEIDNDIAGCIVLSNFMDEVYIPIEWLTTNENNLYIHRLAIHPNRQRKGFAQQMMDFAENFALEKGYKSVRLDTFSKNDRNQKFYERRGYQRLGAIYFPKKSDNPFYCYELIL